MSSRTSTNALRQRHSGSAPQSSPSGAGKSDNAKLPKNSDISMKDLRALIPDELWERSYTKSFYWLFHDIVLVVAMLYLAVTFLNEDYVPFTSFRALLWCLWWYVQGAFMTGIWVIAHECGHQAFTPNKQLNNVVGFIFHTMLLVPYFSWQYTHAQHHARTNNLEDDTVHLPRMKFAKSPKYVHILSDLLVNIVWWNTVNRNVFANCVKLVSFLISCIQLS